MSESDPLSGAYCKRHDIYLCEWCTEIQQLQQSLAEAQHGIKPGCGHEWRFTDSRGDEFEECTKCVLELAVNGLTELRQQLAASESQRKALLEQLVGLLYPGEQWGHHGMHHGNGSPGCPKQLHHHHDDHCDVPTSEMILSEIKNLKESRDHYKEQADLDSLWRNMKKNQK